MSEATRQTSEVSASGPASRRDVPRLLLLETSDRVGQVALALGADLDDVRILEESRRHARDLAPAVAALCSARGWRPRDLDAVFVSRGPGSYTGLRVGLMSAKAFAYAIGCVLLAVDTFAVIAEQAPSEAADLDILADAQQHNVYVQRWRRNAQGKWQSATPLSIVHGDNWLRTLEKSVWVSGPGVKLWQQQIPAANPCVPAEWREPLPASLLKLGLQRWQAGEADDLWTLEPLYLRPSNAEENWARRLPS